MSPQHLLANGGLQAVPGETSEPPSRVSSFDRISVPLSLAPMAVPLVAPIGPGSIKMQRPAASLLPDQEFIPINTESPSLDRMHVFGETPFVSSLFSSPFAMFGPVTSYGGENPGGVSGSGLLADLHADSHPVENATGRHKPEVGNQLV